jgi:hypothetical protein
MEPLLQVSRQRGFYFGGCYARRQSQNPLCHLKEIANPLASGLLIFLENFRQEKYDYWFVTLPVKRQETLD